MSIKYEYKPQTSFSPYPKEVLPEGFQYPDSYLAHAKATNYPKFFLWRFIDYEEQGKIAWENRHYWQSEGWLYLDKIDPIPFARNGDFAAYFDGNDHSGDPKIIVIDLGNKVYGREYADFKAWLDQALKDSGLK